MLTRESNGQQAFRVVSIEATGVRATALSAPCMSGDPERPRLPVNRMA
jgi:hypothetical protein